MGNKTVTKTEYYGYLILFVVTVEDLTCSHVAVSSQLP